MEPKQNPGDVVSPGFAVSFGRFPAVFRLLPHHYWLSRVAAARFFRSSLMISLPALGLFFLPVKGVLHGEAGPQLVVPGVVGVLGGGSGGDGGNLPDALGPVGEG